MPISIILLVLISIAVIMIVIGFVFRIASNRFKARVFITLGTAMLTIFAGLDFFSSLIPNNFDVSDSFRLLFFIFSIILFLYNLIVVVKKY